MKIEHQRPAAKRLARTQNVSVREAEWWLDADAYLQEQRQWAHGKLHCEYLCQQMFLHAAVTGGSEHNCAICQGQREPSPKQDVGVEPTAMELVIPNPMHQDIEDLYQDIYQLCRLPGRGPCEEAMEEFLHKEILYSIKECPWLKWPSAQPEGEWKQLLANAPWPDIHMEFAAVNCSTYKTFAAAKQDSYKEMMALMRDTHQWVLAVATILEERMEK